MRKYLKREYSLIIFVLFLLVSCDLIKTRISIDFDYNLFSAEKNSWMRSKPANYRYNFFRNNPGFEPEMNALIFVENGLYTEQIPDGAMGPEDRPLQPVSSDYQTIDKIYDNIESIYNSNRTKYIDEPIYLTKLIIEYDSINHIPIKTEFYYHVKSGVFDVGNYMVYIISNFMSD